MWRLGGPVPRPASWLLLYMPSLFDFLHATPCFLLPLWELPANPSSVCPVLCGVGVGGDACGGGEQ